MKVSKIVFIFCQIILLCAVVFCSAKPLLQPSDVRYTKQKALNMIKASQRTLGPVYAPLAEEITQQFDLVQKEGIGIDLGGGPGTLIIELCRRTKLHWINADINPYFFPYFYEQADKLGFGHRVSSIFADAQALPFRTNYADIVVSRGSYRFWEDKEKAFREIYRVLKPGGTAYIGRGFSENLPVNIAKSIRAKQGKKMKYDVQEKAVELQTLMEKSGISEYRIHIPKAQLAGEINYGIWLEFHKPEMVQTEKVNLFACP